MLAFILLKILVAWRFINLFFVLMHPKAFQYDLKCTQTGNAALTSEGVCSSVITYPHSKTIFPVQIASSLTQYLSSFERRLQCHRSKEYTNQRNIKPHYLRIMVYIIYEKT